MGEGGGRLVMLREHATDICVIIAFRRPFVCGWYNLPLAHYRPSILRLSVLSSPFMCCAVSYTTYTNKDCRHKIYSYCDNTYISQQQIKVALSYNRLFATLFVTRRLR